MPVLDTPPPPPPYRTTETPNLGRTRLPPDIHAGIVLVLLGVAFTVSSYLWPYLRVAAWAPGDIAGYLQVSLGLDLGTLLCAELGAFLILRGILRLLPRVGSWPRWGPLLILVGALVAAAALVVEIAIAPSIFPPFSGPDLGYVYLGASVAGIAAEVLVAFGTLLALVAIAFGALAGRGQTARPNPP